jgi:hypothetical protein
MRMGLQSDQSRAAKVRDAASHSRVAAAPFIARPVSDIPRRQFLCGAAFQKGHITLTIAPAGVGKTSLNIAEAVHMAAGACLFEAISKPLKVWLFNGEESQDELERRIAGTIAEHRLPAGLVAGNLFSNSGREMPLVLAQTGSDGMDIDDGLVSQLIATIRDNQIDVMIVDPFIATHAVQENNNAAIDKVGKLWAKVANEAGCAVHLVHHTRKSGSDELTADSVRGASSLVAAARYVRALSKVNSKQADTLRLAGGAEYVRIDVVKENNSSTAQKRYFAIKPHVLGNGTAEEVGDTIGVVLAAQFRPQPSIELTDALVALLRQLAAQGDRRVSSQSPDWIGYDLAKALNMDDEQKSGIPRVLKRSLDQKILAVAPRRSPKGKPHEFYVLPQVVLPPRPEPAQAT